MSKTDDDSKIVAAVVGFGCFLLLVKFAVIVALVWGFVELVSWLVTK